MSPQEQFAIEEWLLYPLKARQLAEIIDFMVRGILLDKNQLAEFSEWIRWFIWKLTSPDGATDLLEAKKVLEGGDWTLNLSSGLQKKKKGLTTAEKRSRGWRKLMQDLAHHYAAQDPNHEITSDPLRRWADLHNVHPLHSNHWGTVFKERSGFSFTGRWTKSEYPTNHARDIKIWRSLRALGHLRLVKGGVL